MYSVDIFFGFDILMTFSTGYIDEKNDIEYDCKKVIINYITGWFAIDLVSIMPFDYIFDYVNYSTSLDNLNRFFKILRIQRVSSLPKIHKFKGFFHYIQNFVTFNKKHIRHTRFLF